ncbi:MAG: zinc ribbon domain-containing protein [Deltaproteobacteria bacterium]|nr:zinc ribbon domain-containing protein [Deltaproteobacteria bacterium]
MNCPSCQTELPDSAHFCGACGHKFQAPVAAAAAPVSSSASPSRASNQALTKGNTMSARSIQEIASTPIQISYNDLMKKSWASCKDQMVPLAIGLIVWFVAFGISYVLSMLLIGIPLICALAAGPIIVGHHLAVGKEVSVGTWLGGLKKIVPLTILLVVFGVVVGIAGFITGLIAVFGLSLPFFLTMFFSIPIASVSLYLVLDRDMSFMDALKEAFEIIKAQPADFIAMTLVVNVVGMMGSGILGFGALVSYPVAFMMMGIWLNQVLGSQGGLDAMD